MYFLRPLKHRLKRRFKDGYIKTRRRSKRLTNKRSHDDDVSQRDVRFNQESYKSPKDRDRNINGYIYDEELSNNRNAIYHKKGVGTIHAVRGTDINSTKDKLDDLLVLIGLNKVSNRYKKTKKLHTRVKGKYGETQLTGHSLGGTIANNLSRETGSKATLYNPGRSVEQLHQLAGDHFTDNGKNIHTFRHRLDPISITGSLISKSDNTTTLPGFKHGLNHFDTKGDRWDDDGDDDG